MVTRQWKRELISRCYNLLIKAMFGNGFSDAQCGFKAIKRNVAQELLPQIEDGEWFFDTELLLLAEERGYRISEVPVDWIEDLDTRVEIAPTATKDVQGLLRVRAQRLRRRLSNHRSRARDGTYHGQILEEEVPKTGGVLGERTAGKHGSVRGAAAPLGPDHTPLAYSDDS